MFSSDPAGPLGIETIAHIIQTALTPVFLLSGIAALLNVFASRLARVSDRSHTVALGLEAASGSGRRRLEAQLRFLQRRTRLLDAAVLLGTCGGGATCMAAMLLFVGALRDSTIAGLLYLSFGLALFCTIGALAFFMSEVVLASRGLRERQDAAVRLSQVRGHGENRAREVDRNLAHGAATAGAGGLTADPPAMPAAVEPDKPSR